MNVSGPLVSSPSGPSVNVSDPSVSISGPLVSSPSGPSVNVSGPWRAAPLEAIKHSKCIIEP